MLLIIFGLPGAGKSYLGNLLQKTFGFFHYDGDHALPINMKKMLLRGKQITDRQRSIFFNKLLQQVKKIAIQQKDIAVSQTFIKEKYRKAFLEQFPDARFLLIESNADIRRERLKQRKVGFFLDLEYVKNMEKIFESPEIKHTILINEKDGKEELFRQVKKLFYQKENQ